MCPLRDLGQVATKVRLVDQVEELTVLKDLVKRF